MPVSIADSKASKVVVAGSCASGGSFRSSLAVQITFIYDSGRDVLRYAVDVTGFGEVLSPEEWIGRKQQPTF